MPTSDAGLVQGGGPGGEELEGIIGGGARLGGVSGDPQATIGGQVECLEGEGELADGGMAEPLGAGAVEADIVRGPPGAEVLAARRQLAMRFDRALSCGLCPASVRSMATTSWAWRSQSG